MLPGVSATRGDRFRADYGVTHYDWSNVREVSDADAATLLRLGVVKDIRGWTEDD